MAKSGLTRNWISTALTIPSGSSLSGSLGIAGWPIIGLVMSPSWTAASICFDVSACAGGTFFPLYDDSGTQVSLPVTACTAIANNVQLSKLAGFYGMRIRSGSKVTEATDQGAARVIVVIAKG